ncbi:hypothetical protein M2447_002761 [Ereboglobus sp. PH5-10]|nr:hypothetical protein [Ereboglobus sp. PH5-10]
MEYSASQCHRHIKFHALGVGRSILCMLLGAGFCVFAEAQPLDIIGSGSTVAINGNVAGNAGQKDAVKVTGSDNTVTVGNSGTVTGKYVGWDAGTGGNGFAIVGDDNTLDNSGLIVGGASKGRAGTVAGGHGVSMVGDGSHLINSGSIGGGEAAGTSPRQSAGGHGVYFIGNDVVITNSTASSITGGLAKWGAAESGDGIRVEGASDNDSVTITNGPNALIQGGTAYQVSGSMNGRTGNGIYISQGGTVIIDNDTGALIRAGNVFQGTEAIAITGGAGIYLTADKATITNRAGALVQANQAIITATNAYGGRGMRIESNDTTVINSGSILGGSAKGVIDSAGGDGLYILGDNAVLNNTGVIVGGSSSASAAAGASAGGSGVIIDGDTFGEVTNAGEIRGGNSNSAGTSGESLAGHGLAVTASNQTVISGSVRNSGTISGGSSQYGLKGSGGHGVYIQGNIAGFENSGGGRISGGSSLYAGANQSQTGGSGVIIDGGSFGDAVNAGMISGGNSSSGTGTGEAGHGMIITATNQVSGPGSVKNSGTIIAGSNAGGYVGTGGHGISVEGDITVLENLSGGVITGGSSSSVSGTVQSQTGGSGVTIASGSYQAVINDGLIRGGDGHGTRGANQGGHGLAITASNQLVRTGSIKNSGTIMGGSQYSGLNGAGGHGVIVEGNISIFENALGGRITAGASTASGTGTGGSGVTITTDSFDAIFNAGYIAGGSGINNGSGVGEGGHGIAVTATSQSVVSGTVRNSGTIIAGNNSGGTLGVGGHGVLVEGNIEYFENATGAQITAGAASASGTSTGGSGVIIDGGSHGEIINAGAITGGAASNGTNKQAGHGITITATSQAIGVGLVKNSGTITAGSSSFGGVTATGGHGVYIDGNLASFENALGGRITAGASTASGTGTGGSGVTITTDSFDAISNAGYIAGGNGINNGSGVGEGGHGIAVTATSQLVVSETVRNSGTIIAGNNSGGTLGVGGHGVLVEGNIEYFENALGAQITAGAANASGTAIGGSGVMIAGDSIGEAINAGTIAGGAAVIGTSGSGGHGVHVQGNLAKFENKGAGRISGGSAAASGTSTGGSAVVIARDSFGETINAGELVGGNGSGGAIRTGGHGLWLTATNQTAVSGTVKNSGTITAGNNTGGVVGTGGHGVYIQGDLASFENTGAGRITGGSSSATGTAAGGSGVMIAGDSFGSVVNKGNITGGNSSWLGRTGHGLAIIVDDQIAGTGSITNSGTITGGTHSGVISGTAGHGVYAQGDYISLVNENNGRIAGGFSGATGGAAGSGVFIEGDENKLINGGAILGGYAEHGVTSLGGHGVHLRGDGIVVSNTTNGDISGGNARWHSGTGGHGVLIEGSGAVLYNYEGRISGGGIDRAGSPTSGGDGAFIEGDDAIITNDRGIISGGNVSSVGADPKAGHGLHILGSATSVTNSGSLFGGSVSAAPIGESGHALYVEGRLANLTNAGLIAGGWTSNAGIVRGGDALRIEDDSPDANDKTITNMGTIIGGYSNEQTEAESGHGISLKGGNYIILNDADGVIAGGTASLSDRNDAGHGIYILANSSAIHIRNAGNAQILGGGGRSGLLYSKGGNAINMEIDGAIIENANDARIVGGMAAGNNPNTENWGGHGIHINGDDSVVTNKDNAVVMGGSAESGIVGSIKNQGGDGLHINGDNATVGNSGRILGGKATGGSVNIDGYGININASAGTANITNTGEISGGTGILVSNATSGTIYNTGTITASGSANRAIELASANIISKFDTGSVLNGDVYSSGTGNKLVFQGTVTEDSYFRSDSPANNFTSLTVQTDGTNNTHWTLTGNTTQLDGVNAIAINDGANDTTSTLTITPADDADYNFAHALTGNGTLEIALQESANIISFGTITGNAFTGTVALGTGRFVLGGTANSQGATNLATLENATLRIDAGNRTEVEGAGAIAGLSFNSGTLAVRTSNTTGVNHVEDLLTVSGTLDTTGGGTVEVALSGTAFGPIPATPPGAPALLDQDDYVDSGTAGMVQGPLVAVDVDNGGTVTGIGTQLTIDFIPSSSSTGTIPGSVSSTSAYVQSGTHVADLVYDYYGAVTGSGIYLNYGLAEIDVLDGQTVVVSNDGAANDTLGAILSGDGGYTFTATGNSSIRVGNVNSNYTGTTTITSGTVITITNGAFGNTDCLVINNAGALDLNGRAQTIANGGQIDGILHGSGSLGFGGLVTITSTNTTFTADVGITGTAVLHNTGALGDSGTLFNDGLAQFTAATGTFSKTLAGTGNTELANNSTVSVSGSNTAYSGTFIINTGNRLVAETDANLGAANITGSGVFEKQNAATTITITHANTGFTGTAAVTAGRLAATTIDALGTAEIAVEAGAIFEHLNVTGTLQNKLTGAGTHHVTNSTLTIADAAKYKIANTTLNQPSTLWLATNGVTIGTLNANSGTLAFANPVDTGTIGALGSGTANIVMNAYLAQATIGVNPAGTVANHLTIDDAGNATHSVYINALSEPPLALNMAIELITTGTGAATFLMANEGGKLEYDLTTIELVKGDGSRYTPDTNIWYLSDRNLSHAADAIINTASTLSLDWASAMDSLHLRLGDIRAEWREQPARDSGNIWARTRGYRINAANELSGMSFRQYGWGVTGGADKSFAAENGVNLLGGFIDMGGVDRKFDNDGTGRTRSVGVGAYITLLRQNGWFLDGIARFDRYDNDFDAKAANGRVTRGEYTAKGQSLSLEAGRRLQRTDGWWLEPGVQMAVLWLNGASYSTQATSEQRALKVKVGDSDTWQYRALVRFGKQIPNSRWTPYGKFAAVAVDSNGGRIKVHGKTFNADYDGKRIEMGFGTSYRLDDLSQLHLDYEYAKAQAYDRPWSINLGYRRLW